MFIQKIVMKILINKPTNKPTNNRNEQNKQIMMIWKNNKYNNK